MTLTGGGSVALNPVVGPNCYYGEVCGFPAGYAGTSLGYALPDGSTATLPDFHGVFQPWRNEYRIIGAASGLDSVGRKVRVFKRVDLTVSCRSGRGGGCIRTYVGQLVRVTLD